MAKEELRIEVTAPGMKTVARDSKAVSKGMIGVAAGANKTDKAFGRMRISTAGLRRSLGAIRNNLLLITFAFGGLLIASKRAVDSFKEQYEAEQRLATGLANVEDASAEGARELINYAAALQKTTQYGDETIISMMAMLSTFQLNETAIKELTPRVLDMATATGQDLTAAAIQVGKAFTGQIGALSRSGVVIDQTGLSIARAGGTISEFNFLLGQMDANFKGLAETIGKGPLAQLRKLENESSDLSEEWGRRLLPVSITVKEAMVNMLTVLTEMPAIHRLMVDESLSLAEALHKVRTATDEVIIGELRRLETAAVTKRLLTEAQELNILEKTHEFLIDDKVLDIQEQLTLLGIKNIHLNEQFNQDMITRYELEKATLEIQIQSLRIEGQRFAQMTKFIAPLSILLTLFGIPGAGILGKAGLGISSVQSLLKFLPKFAAGGQFMVTQPQIIMVGERGPERVTIQPTGQGAAAVPSTVINNYFHAPVPEDYIRNEFMPIFNRVQATG